MFVHVVIIYGFIYYYQIQETFNSVFVTALVFILMQGRKGVC